MPYIKNQYRGKINWAIMTIIIDRDLNKSVSDIIVSLDELPKEIFDGALNYACTQILRKLNPIESNAIVASILHHYYMGKPSYVKLKDCIGLLNVMILEFNRRNWGNNRVDNILKYLLQYVTEIYNEYEPQKMAENGDLE
jgi:hypothetical protein